VKNKKENLFLQDLQLGWRSCCGREQKKAKSAAYLLFNSLARNANSKWSVFNTTPVSNLRISIKHKNTQSRK